VERITMGEKEYKEDSTKGSSIIKPINYKGDMTLQAWIDSRLIATLDRWFVSMDYYPRSLSDVAKKAIELLVEHLVETGKVVMVDDTVEARSRLERRFRVNLNRGGRGGKNVLHNQILSDNRREISERYPKSDNDRNDAARGMQTSKITANISKDRFNELVSIAEKLENPGLPTHSEYGKAIVAMDTPEQQAAQQEFVRQARERSLAENPDLFIEERRKKDGEYLKQLNAPLEMPDYLKNK
jgi:hypothetical protein